MYFIIQNLIFKRHLEEGEKIHFVAHKHWLAVMKPIIQVIIFGFATPWLLYMLFSVQAMFLIAAVWSLGATIKLIYEVVDWYCDAWLITSNGIIDLDWKGIFNQTSSRIEYASIEGISYEIKGVWATILKFGTTQIDKVSAANPTSLEMASNPKKIELKVLEHKNSFDEVNAQTDSNHLKDLLVSMLRRHIKEHGWDGVLKEQAEKVIEIEDLDLGDSNNVFHSLDRKL